MIVGESLSIHSCVLFTIELRCNNLLCIFSLQLGKKFRACDQLNPLGKWQFPYIRRLFGGGCVAVGSSLSVGIEPNSGVWVATTLKASGVQAARAKLPARKDPNLRKSLLDNSFMRWLYPIIIEYTSNLDQYPYNRKRKKFEHNLWSHPRYILLKRD